MYERVPEYTAALGLASDQAVPGGLRLLSSLHGDPADAPWMMAMAREPDIDEASRKS